MARSSDSSSSARSASFCSARLRCQTRPAAWPAARHSRARCAYGRNSRLSKSSVPAYTRPAKTTCERRSEAVGSHGRVSLAPGSTPDPSDAPLGTSALLAGSYVLNATRSACTSRATRRLRAARNPSMPGCSSAKRATSSSRCMPWSMAVSMRCRASRGWLRSSTTARSATTSPPGARSGESVQSQSRRWPSGPGTLSWSRSARPLLTSRSAPSRSSGCWMRARSSAGGAACWRSAIRGFR